jgi:hypothetical protein
MLIQKPRSYKAERIAFSLQQVEKQTSSLFLGMKNKGMCTEIRKYKNISQCACMGADKYMDTKRHGSISAYKQCMCMKSSLIKIQFHVYIFAWTARVQ